MASRQAFIIGAERYGEGFAALPAVQQDVAQVSTILTRLGYEVTRCPDDAVSNATALDAAIRTFCESGDADDVRLVYFTGHGLLADGTDWIVPADTSRKDAAASSNQRVSTDLSRTVAAARTGLVLFVIDACRDEEDAPVSKGASGWGDAKGLARPDEARFIRLFGCASGQVCQVLPGDPPSSLFTRALGDSLAAGAAVTLEDLLSRLEESCAGLLREHPLLRPQTARLSYGELSADKRAVLKRPIFEVGGSAPLPDVWPAFNPDKLHCLVVLSEHDHNASPEWGLREMVLDATAGGTGDRIWAAFQAACGGRRLVSGQRRTLSTTLDPTAIVFGSYSVVDALASSASLDMAVRAVIEADLVVFDVTHFEPAVMTLVGIRSACCRSLSVCSHGDGWREGQPIELPFNLQDLSLNSHTPRDTRVGTDPVVERFVGRVETGFQQLARHPQYLDLPGFDTLRQIGPDYTASSTIDGAERILVLCSYDDGFFKNWQFVASRLKSAVWSRHRKAPAIERIIDYGTPQLIRQSLYEQIRRTSATLVDWSGFSASVFLELGARLAVSEFGAVQIIDERFLPGGEKAPEYEHLAEQVARLRRLFDPISYRYRGDAKAFDAIADLLLTRQPHLEKEPAYNQVYRTVLRVADAVQIAMPTVVDDLEARADALHHSEQGRVGAPQVLFHGSRNVKQDSEGAALEMRIAAWLYLEHRLGARASGAPPDLLTLHRKLSRSVADALYDRGDDASIAFAAYIEEHESPQE